MTARKRKSPERGASLSDTAPSGKARSTNTASARAIGSKPGKDSGRTLRAPGLVKRAMMLAARFIGRHPAGFAGTAAFAAVFGVVAANALFQQPGEHPSPFLRTRIPFTSPQQTAIDAPSSDATGAPSVRKVTTFVIEREGNGPGDTATSPAVSPPVATPLVLETQAELARLGLYEGAPDGRNGPRTQTAIRQFQRISGVPQTGLPDPTLLARMQARAAPSATPAPDAPVPVRPAERPVETVEGEDPVAAAIRVANEAEGLVPKADIPDAPKPSTMVMTIQKGLSNLAYADISIDGVAGNQTRAAIRDFEKHYRLPETGEPNNRVLGKLKEIGAL